LTFFPWAHGYNLLETRDNIALFSTTRSDLGEERFKWVGPLAVKKFAFNGKSVSGIKIQKFDDAKAYKIGVQKDGVSEQFLAAEGFPLLNRVIFPLRNLHNLLRGNSDLWYAGNSTINEVIASWQKVYKQLYDDGVVHKILKKHGLSHLIPSTP
jgi:polar amino acid transport system substrate-binding protein